MTYDVRYQNQESVRKETYLTN